MRLFSYHEQVMKIRSLMTRQTWLLVHRFVGLVMAFFLVVAGLTGCILAFYEELDTAINAEMMLVAPPSADARPLDPLVLREQLQARYPHARFHHVSLAPKPGHAWRFFRETVTDPVTGAQVEGERDMLYVNPYTGEVLGTRKWGDMSQGVTNLIPFILRLHYSLALGEVGSLIFGIVALLWTLDCFVGAYLTFPAPARRQGNPSSPQPVSDANTQHKNWLLRWWQSWTVRWRGGGYKVTFDLHRAGGLWPWAMLVVLAWSSVGFNLPQVFNPVMDAFFAKQQTGKDFPKLAKAQPEPGIPWVEALNIGHGLMEAEARRKGFEILEPMSLSYDAEDGVYGYGVRSDRDLEADRGRTWVMFDANTGEQRDLFLPTGEASGDTVKRWLFVLHTAAIGGLPYQIFMCLMGGIVATSSIAGVIIWWKKRTARRMMTQRQPETSGILPSSQATH